MLIPHPAMLRKLVHNFETLRNRYATDPTAENRRQMNDAAYTVCVTTGTRDIDTALIIAHRLLASAAGSAAADSSASVTSARPLHAESA